MSLKGRMTEPCDGTALYSDCRGWSHGSTHLKNVQIIKHAHRSPCKMNKINKISELYQNQFLGYDIVL